MAESVVVFPIKALPGVKRDGTDTEGQYWNSSTWMRFYHGLPRSIGGYRVMSEDYDGPSRGLFIDSRDGLINIFSGHADGLEVGQFTSTGFGATPVDITPAGFVTSDDNVWQFAKFATSTGGRLTYLIAHAAPNLAAIDSQTETSVYYGDITGTTFTAITLDNTSGKTSGGVMVLHPFVIVYGNNGEVNVSDVGTPGTFVNTSIFNVCGTKIVKGFPVRGGSASPAGLLWSLESLIRMSFVGGTTVWNFDTITDETSILSSSGVVEYDGSYFWIGIDRFLAYSGVVREIPNNLNLDFFFSNLNYSQRQKVYGFKNQKWGEIVWCAPLFGATECNWAIIFNLRENTWYDTPLPTGGRSAAVTSKIFQYPVMSTATPLDKVNGTGVAYPVWQHEFGVDEVRGNKVKAIKSSVTTPDLSIVGSGLSGGTLAPSDNVWTMVVKMEPDFKMGPELKINVFTRKFPMSANREKNYTITNTTEKLDMDGIQGRYIRYEFVSNTQGGYFIMGQPLVYCRKGDPQP